MNTTDQQAPIVLTGFTFKSFSSGWNIQPATMSRSWMDATHNKFAYRCLPLIIANQAGWSISSPIGFTAYWRGFGKPQSAIKIKFDSDADIYAESITSHFGYGILTFVIPMLFRTPDNLALSVRGIPNAPKTNCYPLEGIVESGWSPFTFTMNWKFQLPFFPVRFEQGEPICFIQPISLDCLEKIKPELLPIEEDKVLKSHHSEWARSRKSFNENEAQSGSWQKHYFRGTDFHGHPPIDQHRTKLHLKPFNVPLL